MTYKKAYNVNIISEIPNETIFCHKYPKWKWQILRSKSGHVIWNDTEQNSLKKAGDIVSTVLCKNYKKELSWYVAY